MLAVSAGRLFALHEASVTAMLTATTGLNKRMNCIKIPVYFADSIGSITLSKASILGASVRRLPLMKNVGVALTPNVSLARVRAAVSLVQ